MKSEILSAIIMVLTLVLARGGVGHYGGVGYVQPLDAMHPAVLVHYGHGIRGGAHLAGADQVLRRPDHPVQPGVQRVVGGQILVGGVPGGA